MPYQEFVEWKLFFNRQPFGFYRDDIRAGYQTMQTLMPYASRGSTLKLNDFVLKFKASVKTQDWQSIRDACRAWAEGMKKQEWQQ